MENSKMKTTDLEIIITENIEEIEREKEQKFVNLLIEIILSKTLKEYYEKGNTISEI